jgi:hypothetical protein
MVFWYRGKITISSLHNEASYYKKNYYSRKRLTITEIKIRISNKYSTLFPAFISTLKKLRSSCKSAVIPSEAAQ